MDEVSKQKIVIELPLYSNLSFGCIDPRNWGQWVILRMSMWNYHSALRSNSEECRLHIIWWCRPWFGSAWSSSELSGLVLSGSAFHMRI